MIGRSALYRRMAALLFVLIMLLGGSFFWLLNHTSSSYQQEVMQKLNLDLAQNLVESDSLLANGKVNHQALEHLFHLLMVINPSIEVYLLDKEGRILAYSAPEGKVKRGQVDMEPLKRFMAGRPEQVILGDDPRSLDKQKVFSAAPILREGVLQGYLYVILGGEAYAGIASGISDSYTLRAAMWLLLTALIAGLAAGLLGFGLITRRVVRLSEMMQSFSSSKGGENLPRYPVKAEGRRDEIDFLGICFNDMAERIERQLTELVSKDVQRREMIANISHDLRTPLTSLHGYLETLILKNGTLDSGLRRKYLSIAAKQSSQLIRLVSELFELAKLDSCEARLNEEAFSLAELAQDVVNKFRLKAEERQIRLVMDCPLSLPPAWGDIGLIQRVLDNLIENALEHTPPGGQIYLSVAAGSNHVSVEISDTGEGIPEEELPLVFERFYRLDKSRGKGARHAGLGLAIAKRILELHRGRIWAVSRPEHGTTFGFEMGTGQFVTES